MQFKPAKRVKNDPVFLYFTADDADNRSSLIEICKWPGDTTPSGV